MSLCDFRSLDIIYRSFNVYLFIRSPHIQSLHFTSDGMFHRKHFGARNEIEHFVIAHNQNRKGDVRRKKSTWPSEEVEREKNANQQMQVERIHGAYRCINVLLPFFLHVYSFLGVPRFAAVVLGFFFSPLKWNTAAIYDLPAMLLFKLRCNRVAKKKTFVFVVVLVSSISRSQVINWKLYGKTDWRHETSRREVVHTTKN